MPRLHLWNNLTEDQRQRLLTRQRGVFTQIAEETGLQPHEIYGAAKRHFSPKPTLFSDGRSAPSPLKPPAGGEGHPLS